MNNIFDGIRQMQEARRQTRFTYMFLMVFFAGLGAAFVFLYEVHFRNTHVCLRSHVQTSQVCMMSGGFLVCNPVENVVCEEWKSK